MGRNTIQLKIARKETYKLGATRFGGKPDVPPDFVWPTYEGESYDHEVKDRPLTFLAQFNCEELAQFDKDHLLPDHGLLSFYETATHFRSLGDTSFRSLGDTYFARDDKQIYAYGKQLPKADLPSWELLSHWYFCDARRVYYLNRVIKGADRDSFTVCTPLGIQPLADRLACDKEHFYQDDEMIEELL